MRITLTTGKLNIYAVQRLKRRIKRHTPKSPYDDCPFCGSYLVVRISKENHRFIGCTKYPKCKFTAEERAPHARTFSRAEGHVQG